MISIKGRTAVMGARSKIWAAVTFKVTIWRKRLANLMQNKHNVPLFPGVRINAPLQCSLFTYSRTAAVSLPRARHFSCTLVTQNPSEKICSDEKLLLS